MPNETVELFLPLDRLKILAVQNTLPDGRAISWRAEERFIGGIVLVRSVESPIDSSYNEWLGRTDWPQWGRVLEVRDVNGQAWIVRKWVEGASLETLIGDGTTVIPENAARILFSRLCRVVARLHGLEQAHGRLKPGNVIAQGSKLIVVDPESNTNALRGNVTELTQEFHVTGDLHYLSPEQLSGFGATPASDVYSIGCMLYETLAGRPPYGHANPVMLVSQHFTGEHDPLWKFRTDISDTLEMLIRKCLSKDAELRFASAMELEHALLQGVEGEESELAITAKYEESMQLLTRLRKARVSEDATPSKQDGDGKAQSQDEPESPLLSRLKKEQDDAATASEAVLSQAIGTDPPAAAGPSRTSQLSRSEINEAMEMSRVSTHITPLEPLHILRPQGEMMTLQDWELIRPPWSYDDLEPMEPLPGVFLPTEEEQFLSDANQPFMAGAETREYRRWRLAFFLVLIYAIAVTILLFKTLLLVETP